MWNVCAPRVHLQKEKRGKLTQTHHPGMVLRGMMYAPVVISTEVANTAEVTE
jgi:hypothetical protein